MKRSSTAGILTAVLLLAPLGSTWAGSEIEEIRETQKQILQQLEEQEKLLRQIAKQTGNRAAEAAPKNDAHEIPVAHSAVRGPRDAKVTLTEFSDFQCPYCARSTGLVETLLEEFPKDLRFVYKQLPLSRIHPNAMPAAKASIAAGNQGKFWEMHDTLFENYNRLSKDKIREIAENLDLDMEQFEKDWKAPETENLVQKDMKLARKVGVRGTPTFFLNGKKVENRSLGALKAQVRKEIEKAKNGE